MITENRILIYMCMISMMGKKAQVLLEENMVYYQNTRNHINEGKLWLG